MNSSELRLPKNEWDLVELFYPDYHRSDDVHRSDVLERYFHDEIDEEDYEDYFETKTPDRVELTKEKEELDTYLFQRSLKECIMYCRGLDSAQLSEMLKEDVTGVTKTYFLFGDEISNIALTHDFQDVIDAIEDGVYHKLFAYDKLSNNPLELLSEAGGSNYAVLSRLEYETLNNL